MVSGVGGFFGSGALSATGFWGGAVVGSASGFAGGFVGAAGNAWMNGASFGSGVMSGLKAGGIGGLIGGAIGGVAGGIRASKEGRYFWSGKIDEIGGADISQKVKYVFLDEEIPDGHSSTHTGEIAKWEGNSKYGEYGMTRNNGLKAHRGLDFSGDIGDSVYAMHDGTVDAIGGSKAFGPYRIRVKVYLNGKTYYNNYGHLSKNLVNIGDKVIAGQQIGIMGEIR